VTETSHQTDPVVEMVLARLGKVRRSGNGFTARCPAHDDQQPSLTVSAHPDGGVQLHCWVGCTWSAIVSAIGLDPQRLVPPRPTGHARRPIRQHDYTDAAGVVVASKLRWAGRGAKFSWVRPDGSRGLDGLDPGLYRLPEVLDAVREGRPIYLVEGERDADTVARFGVTASTGPHGAGTWRPAWTAVLMGASVFVVADRDDAGLKHAARVAQELETSGCGVVRLVVPEGHNDLSDLLEAVDDPPAAIAVLEGLPDLDSYVPSRAPVRLTSDGRPLFAMVPVHLAEELDPECIKLFAICDGSQQGNGRPVAGRNLLAKRSGLTRDEVTRHMGHLEAAGLVRIEQEGQQRAAYRVINPSRTSTSGPSRRPLVDRQPVRLGGTCGPSGRPRPRSGGSQEELSAVGEEHLQRGIYDDPARQFADLPPSGVRE
jgi:DNA-binding transcriptional ArsR family regulator